MRKEDRDLHELEKRLHIQRSTGMTPEHLTACMQAIVSCLQGMSQRPGVDLLLNSVRLENYDRFTRAEIQRTLLYLVADHVLDLDEQLRPFLVPKEPDRLPNQRRRKRRRKTRGS